MYTLLMLIGMMVVIPIVWVVKDYKNLNRED